MSDEKVHATLGASSAHRWMACPGSVRLSEGQPSFDSEHAREGTAAHMLAEWCLTGPKEFVYREPDERLGDTINGVEVTEEMVQAVGMFVEHCRDLEQEPGLLHVVDLKYGKGVIVEVRGNKQLKYYGLGAFMELHNVLAGPRVEQRFSLESLNPPSEMFGTADFVLVPPGEINRVRITIVQPRVAHADGPIRSEDISVADLVDFSTDLLEAAKATQAPNAPLVVGNHCRFCPALAICPAQAKSAQALAQVEFADMPVSEPPNPATLPIEVLADILQKAPILESWLGAARARAQRLLEQGEEVPGFKLVARRAMRRWVDTEQAKNWLEEKGYDREDITESKLRSPAQIERVMGKQKKTLPVGFIEKKSSGYTMAPTHDVRPTVALRPGDEFLALESGEPNGQEIEE